MLLYLAFLLDCRTRPWWQRVLALLIGAAVLALAVWSVTTADIGPAPLDWER